MQLPVESGVVINILILFNLQTYSISPAWHCVTVWCGCERDKCPGIRLMSWSEVPSSDPAWELVWESAPCESLIPALYHGAQSLYSANTGVLCPQDLELEIGRDKKKRTQTENITRELLFGSLATLSTHSRPLIGHQPPILASDWPILDDTLRYLLLTRSPPLLLLCQDLNRKCSRTWLWLREVSGPGCRLRLRSNPQSSEIR